MAGTQGTNVAAGGLRRFPSGTGVGSVGSGVGAGGSTGTRALPMTPAQHVMTHLGNAGVPQGRPTGGLDFTNLWAAVQTNNVLVSLQQAAASFWVRLRGHGKSTKLMFLVL